MKARNDFKDPRLMEEFMATYDDNPTVECIEKLYSLRVCTDDVALGTYYLIILPFYTPTLQRAKL